MNIIYKGEDQHIRYLGDKELYHWKYVKKIPEGKGFRYFYSWDEYRAFLADPAADLQKTGRKAANQLQSTGNRAGQEIKTARKSAQKYVVKGRKSVEKAVKSADRSKITVAGVRQVNAQRSPSLKQRMNEFAKKVSQKWNAGKEAVQETAEKGKKWVEDAIKAPGRKIKDWKEERKRKKIEKEKAEKEMRAKKREELAKKYKYIKRIKINGEYKYFYSQADIDAYEKRDEYRANEPDFMKDVKHSESPYTSDEDAIQVNPKFDLYDFNQDYEFNCAECTAIYELRRRVYDVESNGESGLGANKDRYNTDRRFDLFYEDAETNYLPTAKSDEQALKNLQAEFDKMPPGSRGDISFVWKAGGGHSIVWEKDEKGNVHLIDSQISGHGNKIEYDMEELVNSIDNTTKYRADRSKKVSQKLLGASGTQITRTDNVELKPEIKKICQDTNDKKRAKPNTTDVWKIRNTPNGAYIDNEGPMSEEEMVKKYSNLT